MRSASSRRCRSSDARPSCETLRALMPRAEGEGRRVGARRRRAGIGQEPAGARVLGRGRGRRRPGRSRAACDAMVRTPYGPFVEALDHLARVTEPGRAACRARHPRRRAHPAGPEPAGPGRRAAPADRGRPGHRAPSPAHRGHRSAGRHRRRAAAAAGARGRALGRRADPAPAPPSRPRRPRARACWSSPPSATPRATCPRRSRRRSPTCGAPTTSSACTSTASPPPR